MEAIVLTWNPIRWNEWEPPYDRVVEMVRAGERRSDRWSVGRHRNISPGTDAWLLLQGERRGLVGYGTVTSEPFEEAHHSEEGKTTRYVYLEWHSLLPVDDRIPPAVLSAEVPGFNWSSIRESGTAIKDSAAAASLKDLWERYVGEPNTGDRGQARSFSVPPEARTGGVDLLRRLIGVPIRTVRGRINKIIGVQPPNVLVATERSPEGQHVPIAWVDHALRLLTTEGSVEILTDNRVPQRVHRLGAPHAAWSSRRRDSTYHHAPTAGKL